MSDTISNYLLNNGSFDADDIQDNFEASEVIYYSEGLDIISRYEAEYGSEAEAVVSGIEYEAADWRLAMMCYAQAINECVERSELNDDIKITFDELEKLMLQAEELGFYGDLEFSIECPHGWAPHNREDSDGLMFWDKKEGGYNPELIEGEFMAVSLKLSCGIYATATWTPDED